MSQTCYTAITFAPVQGFIEKSRKLRDLYGSSFILSYLAWSICQAAKRHGCEVISPALPNVTQGMPNQIIIKGVLPEEITEDALKQAWGGIVQTCRQWIEDNVTGEWDYKIWRRDWGLWEKYTWEFFWVTGKAEQSVSEVRELLNEKKRSRNWTAVNWTGESSTLSGADAIAYPSNQIKDIRERYYAQEKQAIKKFYKQLSLQLGEAFIESVFPEARWKYLKEAKAAEYGSSFVDPDEQLSIPELIKRLITHKAIVNDLFSLLLQEVGESNELQSIQAIADDLNPETFKDLDRLKRKKSDVPQLVEERFTGWFQGDGDGAGNYFRTLKPKSIEEPLRQQEIENEATELSGFSNQMRDWGHQFKDNPPKFENLDSCRVIYAGGDDFLGVFYRPNNLPELQPIECIKYFSTFKSQVWHGSNPKKIQVSIGFVWAAPKVPQRDVLQHCREAEKSAKSNGRDRIAFRILFNGGNYLDWVCPWWLLEEGLLDAYGDHNGKQGLANKPNWGHFYEDVAILESRHAFKNNTDVAMGLIEIYFGRSYRDLITNNLWSERTANQETGILGSPDPSTDEVEALNNWAINLAKVGFHLCQQKK